MAVCDNARTACPPPAHHTQPAAPPTGKPATAVTSGRSSTSPRLASRASRAYRGTRNLHAVHVLLGPVRRLDAAVDVDGHVRRDPRIGQPRRPRQLQHRRRGRGPKTARTRLLRVTGSPRPGPAPLTARGVTTQFTVGADRAGHDPRNRRGRSPLIDPDRPSLRTASCHPHVAKE